MALWYTSLTFRYRLFGQELNNITHWTSEDFGDPGAMRSRVNDALDTRFVPKLRNFLVQQATVIGTRTQTFNADTKYTAIDNESGAIGIQDDNPAPLQTSLVISLKSAFAGKKGNGRVYMGGCGLTKYAEGRWTLEPFNAWTDIVYDLAANLAASFNVPNPDNPGVPYVLRPVILTRVPGTPPTYAYSLVNNAVVRDIVRTQRRRVLGVGI